MESLKGGIPDRKGTARQEECCPKRNYGSAISWPQLLTWGIGGEFLERLSNVVMDQHDHCLCQHKNQHLGGWKTLFGRRYSGSSKPCWEEEVIKLFGRRKSVRPSRIRRLAERFIRRLLPLFQRRTKQVGELLPPLYLQGLSLGEISS
jgi:hypothetical protein